MTKHPRIRKRTSALDARQHSIITQVILLAELAREGNARTYREKLFKIEQLCKAERERWSEQ